MNEGIKEASRWLKNKSQPLPKLIDGAMTKGEIYEKIRRYWENDWRSEEGAKETRKELTAKFLLEPPAEFLRNIKLPGWNEEDPQEGNREAFNNVNGAGSVDGWKGCETRCMPLKMRDRFYELTKKWRMTGKVPDMIRTIRQAMILKPGKEPTVENLRPLSIMSVFWRAFECSLTATKTFRELKRALQHKEGSQPQSHQCSWNYCTSRPWITRERSMI